MTRLNTVLVTGAMVLVAVGVPEMAVYLAQGMLNNTNKAKPICPSGQRSSHEVIVQNGNVSPSNTIAPLCDTLTITNLDDAPIVLAFGLHIDHKSYDGISERFLTKGQRLTITLIQSGSFIFHDHIQDKIQGTFTVIQRNTEPSG